MNVELLSTQQQQGPGISDYVSVVKRRIWHVVVPCLLLGAAGFGLALILPKEYWGRTEVFVEDPDSMVGSVFTPLGYSVPHKHLLTTIKQDVNRAEFLAPLVEQYGVTEGFNPSLQRDRNRMFERIRRRLTVTMAPPGKTGPDLIQFSYEGRDAVRVTEFVNAVRRKWQDEFMKRYSDAVKAVEQNIRTVYNDALETYTNAQVKLKNFQEENGSDYFGKDPGGQAKAQVAMLTRDLDTWETQLRGEEASLRIVTEQLEKVVPVVQTDASRTRNPEWIAQSQVIDKLASEIAQARELKYLDTWPPLQGKLTRIEEEQRKLEKIEQWTTDKVSQSYNTQWVMLTNTKSMAESSIASLRERIDKTKKRIEELDKDIKYIPEKAAQAQTLRDAVDNAYVVFQKADRTRESAKATKDRTVGKAKNFFRVVSETTPEEARFADPFYPNPLLFAGFGAFLGLVLGGGFAFISEFAAASFTTTNQVRYSLQVPVLGEISPLLTRTETRTKKRRRLLILAALLFLVVVVTVIHLMWFDQDWRANLPPFIRDIMRRAYGAGAG